MNDLEMYREQLAICDDKIIDALVDKKFDCREDHGLQRNIWNAHTPAGSGSQTAEQAGGEA